MTDGGLSASAIIRDAWRVDESARPVATRKIQRQRGAQAMLVTNTLYFVLAARGNFRALRNETTTATITLRPDQEITGEKRREVVCYRPAKIAPTC